MAKRRTEAAEQDAPTVVPTTVVPRNLLAFGLAPAERDAKDVDQRWLAYRVENGVAVVITPKRHGRDFGESMSAACARVSHEMGAELPRMNRPRGLRKVPA